MKLINILIGTYIRLALLFAVFTIASCKKLVDVSAPVTSVNSANVYNNDGTAAAVLTGIYTNMVNSGGLSYTNLLSLSLFSALSADELTLTAGLNNTGYTQYYTNSLTSVGISPDYWSNIYQMIYVVNAAIEGLNVSSGLTPSVKQQALGEAEFMRAFCYFYLVNLYGDVPLVLTSNYQINSVITRTPQAEVWRQIITDLQNAQSSLSSSYLDATLQNLSSQRVRPTKWAAAALLARAYLYTSDWADAETEADSVIANTTLFNLDPLNAVFLANSTEAIWQLQPVQLGYNTLDAQLFIIPPAGPSGNWPVYLSPYLLNSFEAGDQRKTIWIDSVIAGGVTYYYAFKYKSDSLNAPVTEYEMVLRLGEQYLIRAEAEAQLNDLSDAVNDLNMIRNRAGLPNTSGMVAASKSSLLTAILHERQVEFFTEWGHRWLDLKRTATINEVMTTITPMKGSQSWNADWQWYPIAISQLQLDPNLVQNAGY